MAWNQVLVQGATPAPGVLVAAASWSLASVLLAGFVYRRLAGRVAALA